MLKSLLLHIVVLCSVVLYGVPALAGVKGPDNVSQQTFFQDGFYAPSYGIVSYQYSPDVGQGPHVLGAKLGIQVLSSNAWFLGLGFTGAGIGSLNYAYYGPALDVMMNLNSSWSLHGFLSSAKGEMRYTKETKSEPKGAWNRYSIHVAEMGIGIIHQSSKNIGVFAALTYRESQAMERDIVIPKRQNLTGKNLQFGLVFMRFMQQ